jgi:ketosteroid isomerase-like protein
MLTPDETAIAEIEREMASAQAVEGVTRTWDDDVVYYDIQPGGAVGKEAATAVIAEQFRGVKHLRTKILQMTVHVEGTIGYAFSTQNFISDVTTGGPGLNFIFRETDIFVKKDGKWRLVHQHLSVPVDFASGRAVFSSQEPLTPAHGSPDK